MVVRVISSSERAKETWLTNPLIQLCFVVDVHSCIPHSHFDYNLSFVVKLEVASRTMSVCRRLCRCLCLWFCLCLWLIPLFWNWNLLGRYQCADGTRGGWSSCIWVLILEIACFPQHNQLWLVIIQLGAVLIIFVREKKIYRQNWKNLHTSWTLTTSSYTTADHILRGLVLVKAIFLLKVNLWYWSKYSKTTCFKQGVQNTKGEL